MGVYFKDMEMPENCKKCDYSSVNDYEYHCQRRNYKTIMSSTLTRQGRPNWCPMIEVKKPHGDLVDVAELLLLKQRLDEYGSWVVDASSVAAAPTIIEAEE